MMDKYVDYISNTDAQGADLRIGAAGFTQVKLSPFDGLNKATLRLAELVSRTSTLADRLCGPASEAINPSKGVGRIDAGLIDQLEGAISRLTEISNDIDANLTRIERRL